jgi:hypothetical protein
MSRLGALLLGLTWIAAGQDATPQNWTHTVRIGGHGLSLDRVDTIVRGAAETNVFGIETDNDIPGRYESFLNPNEKLKAIRAMAEKAHAAGNRAFVYVAALECITANAAGQPHSFFKDHPDWVQRNRKGEPAMFGGGVAFWVKKGDEDVWISPYPPEWRKRYMELIRQIASTGIDGIWIDIPYWMTHFEGWEDTWASFDDYTVAAFKARTGLDARKDFRLGDFKDPGFRRWVDFRIASLTAFVKEIDENIKAVNPQCMTIPEIYPGIEEPATIVGADVYELYPVVDAIGHEYDGGASMAASKSPLDWFSYMMGMYSFRAFAGGKATWMLSYSWDGEKGIDRREAMKNLFLAEVMAGANAYDAQGHVMSGSNDLATRKAAFGWIRDHEKTLYRPRTPIRPVGVYFSPTTRNYFGREFIESFKGTMLLLMHSHREFQIVTPRTLDQFAGDVLILPDARCLGDAELRALDALAAAGKKLVATGETGAYALDGEPRAENPVLRRSGVRQLRECPGRAYFGQLAKEFNGAAAAGSAAGTAFEKARAAFDSGVLAPLGIQSAVEIAASPFTSAQIARVDGKPHVFLANFKGLKSKQNARQMKEAGVRVRFSEPNAKKVFLLPYLGVASEVSSKRDGAWLSAVLPEIDKGAVVWCE